MAPIIVACASTDEDSNLYGAIMSGGKLGHCADALLVSRAAAAEGRDDDDDAAAEPGDGEPVDEANESKVGRRQSNLFVDENKVNGSEDPFPSIRTSYPPSPCAFKPQGLSLMHSFSPTSSLEDVDINDISMQPFDDFAILLSQINADEELARQLQDEENKKNRQPKPKAKVNVVPSFADSLFGEPSPGELRSQYTKVTNSSSSGSDFPDSVSGGISMLTSSFKKWGNGITAAATDFFGEDIDMQVRHLSANSARSQYRNAV
mmetsp:Transcript_10931/g.19958  ORF Transcript_10931/g.19958 Transcript_10931/m.19958 type:complete len:262 (-) Transcript_10931:147-932(-)|eukprot:CAMPEP_0201894170 /NCGR_PEP_ID=MMETSP0902-20130614/40182_1 /ASSEMBLY_ACC=CAM_ASM_000551 /TAXON_ID=420261 /ORGANISM="Thalassiosira antarctica, Strain CCMP982" /LENGTH=261 /DNA_ID=CAMNT_0048426157 /DNA_START=14 /DNA_END=799 /DNA_ORIENTATION=+